MSKELVTIKTFLYSYETLVYESRFQVEGIYYHLKNHLHASADPFISSALGGIELQVWEDDAERAMAVVEEMVALEKADEANKKLTLDGKSYEKVLDECPKCDSEEVFVESLSFFKSLIASFQKKNHYCKTCGKRWKQYLNT